MTMMDNRGLEETMASLQRSMASDEEFSQTYQDMENFLADYPQRIVSQLYTLRCTVRYPAKFLSSAEVYMTHQLSFYEKQRYNNDVIKIALTHKFCKLSRCVSYTFIRFHCILIPS